MLPMVFMEFKLIHIFLLFFSFRYHCQLVKGQFWQKSGGAGGDCRPPSLPGFYRSVIFQKVFTLRCLYRSIVIIQ